MDDDLQQAIAFVKSGQKKQGGQILAEIVKRQPNNESAWLWLADCVNTNQQKIFCLNKALEINPQNDAARKFIQKLQSDQEQQFQFVDNPPAVSQNAVQFIQANCPYCDGELRVPSNRQNIKCMFCGGDIIVQGNNLVALKPKNTSDHLLSLALAAEEATNYEEAYKYYSQVLEQDSSISVAWIGKGISAGWLSSAQGQRIDEAMTCITKGLDSNNNDTKWIEHAALSLIHITQSYTKVICEYLTEVYEAEVSPRSNGVLLDPVMAGVIIGARRPGAEKKVSTEFWQTHRPVITRASNYAWNLFPSIEIATGIYNIINFVNKSVLSSGVKSGFEEGFQKTRLTIKDKFPQWQPPKSKKEWCFIATATMGDYNHPYVIRLREYRDKNLLHNNVGKVIVQTYYRVSPPIAKIIERNSFLRMLSLYLIIKPSIFLVNLVFSHKNRV